jgi:hypothetical protein
MMGILVAPQFSRSLSDKDRRASGDLRRGSADEKPLRHSSKSAEATAGGGSGAPAGPRPMPLLPLPG